MMPPASTPARGRIVHLANSRRRPAKLYVLDCPACRTVAGPFALAEAELLGGTHDDLHHCGQPTVLVLLDDQPPPAGSAALGGAA